MISKGIWMNLQRKSQIGGAREWMHRPAYKTEKLSYQARIMIRSQGQQMEHKSVDEYVSEKCIKRGK